MSTQHPGATLTDPQFLAGLDAILEPYYARQAPEDEIRDIVKRAEAFFLSSSQTRPDLEQPAPLEALSSVPPADPPASTAADPPYPPTFAELAALIASGEPIPGIRDIPDELAPEPPSEPKAPARRKPWEDQVERATAGNVGLDSERLEHDKQEHAEEGSAQV
ncbi:hypothetical protein JCM8208_005068 [Rhodotorula glutinis]